MAKKDIADAGAGAVNVKEAALESVFDARGLQRRRMDQKAGMSELDQFAQRQILHEVSDTSALNEAIYMHTGCLPFDLVTAGKGIPRGCATLLYSGFGAGKSTLLLTAARGLCMNGYKVLYVDAESSDNTCRQMGLIGPPETLLVPAGSFKYITLKYYNELERVGNAFIKTDFDVIFLDSITAVGISPDGLKKNNKTVEDASAIGTEARIQSKWIKEFYLRIKNTDQAIVYIAQERNRIDFKNPMNNGPAPAASNASKFFNNIQVKMRPSTLIKDGLRVVGRQAYLISEKNRDADGFVSIPATVIFGRGVSNVEMLKLMGRWLGLFVQRGGHWSINLPGAEAVSVNGQVALNNWIKENYSDLTAIFYDNAPDFLTYIANGNKDIEATAADALFQQSGSDEEDEAGEEALSGEEIIDEVSDEDISSALNEADETTIIS